MPAAAAKSKCRNCGRALPKRSRFCPECGSRVGDEAVTETAEIELPPSETGPVPVHLTSVTPRFFGVTPAMLVFALATAALALAVLLLATAHWLTGVVCLAASLLLFAAFLEVARRKPDTAVARASADAFAGLRARAGLAVDAVAIRSQAGREIARLRREHLELCGERESFFRDLGGAVYRGDEPESDELRARIGELEGQIAAKEEAMASVVATAHERFEAARRQVRPTEMVEVPQPPIPTPDPSPDPMPGPPTPVPEPMPTPIPEPYPPPDEATPPEPARVPEPGPPGPDSKK